MSIITLSNIGDKVADEYPSASTDDVTAANFPALVAAWLSDKNVSNTWTDVIGGLVLTRNTGDMDQNANGTITTGAISNTPPAASTLLPGTKTVMLIHTGTFFTTNLGSSVGTPSVNDGFGFLRSGSIYYADSNFGATYHVVPLAVDGVPAAAGVSGGTDGVVTGIIINFSGHSVSNTTDDGLSVGHCFEHDGTTFNIGLGSSGTGAGDQSAGIDSVTTDEAILTQGGHEHYGIYVLAFTNYPANWKDAVAWMQANPTKGLYPGFIGMS